MVSGGELVVGYGSSVVVRMMVIAWLPLGQKVYNVRNKSISVNKTIDNKNSAIYIETKNRLPRRITINNGKEGKKTAIKYTSAQMSFIDYQAMNTGPKKFRSSPYARVHWAKHQGNQW